MKLVKNYLSNNNKYSIMDNVYQGGMIFFSPYVLASNLYPTSNLLNPIRKKEVRFNAGKYIIHDTVNNLVDYSTYDGSEDTILRFRKFGFTDADRENQTGLMLQELQDKMNDKSSTVNNYVITGTAGGYITISADSNFSFNNGANSYFKLLGFTAASYSGSNTYTSEKVAWHRTWNNIYMDISGIPNTSVNSLVLLWGDKTDNKLSVSAVVKLKGYSSFIFYTPTATPDFETTITIDNARNFSSAYFSNRTETFWVLEIFDKNNYNAISIGNIVLGENIEIQTPDIGFIYNVEDTADKNLNKYNIEFVNNYVFKRSLGFQLSLMDWADSEKLHNLYLEIGSRYNLWFELDETDVKFSRDVFSMWCKFDDKFSLAHKVRDVFSGQLTLREVN